jgi:CRP/FNR family transcriptional regulator, cyclic AMP receptor protein
VIGFAPEAFKAGEVILREGDKADKMYVIRSGEVVIERAGHVVATLPPGAMFGEMALIDGSPRSGTARAKTDCEVAVISEETFLFLIHETPFFAMAMMRTLGDRQAACKWCVLASVSRRIILLDRQ